MEAGSSGQYIQIADDLNLYVETSGQGALTIVFVPGWTMTTEVFRYQYEHFIHAADVRFLSYDPRSHGRSSRTVSGHTYEQHGRDLHQLLQKLALNDVVLCGWSFGTIATLSYVHQFGLERLKGFIMLDGPPRATGQDNESDWVTYSYDDADGSQAFYTMGKLRNPEETNREFARWMLEDKSDLNIEWLIKQTEQTPNTVASLLNATANFLDYRDDLIKIANTVPTWYVVRASQESVVATWREQNTPEVPMTAFGEHLMFWEQSERFNESLDQFLLRCT